ncbi:CEP68 isoform 2 [Pan troglodytes]|uniref:Centrosomal protein of 68 kDa n=2 Tax=Pan troglodytes TaxID=9598 RepID=K7BHF1_PANTR|nr:centrosomal protein of 68 kDa isoform X1 [Pan troglodytes]XP_016804127.2 centrosomal protein of 68 kDa isoform X1 [Pan troglodytes]PNI66472.1 CEP68 isoform 2 [Pan troglodytes]
MALGEEKAEAEASEDTKAQSYGRGSCRERELDIPGPMSGEQPPRLEAEGGLISPVWGAEGIPAPTCWIGTDPGGPSRAHQPQASDANREPVAERSEPALSGLPPATMGSGDLLLSGESQVEKTKLSSSEEFPQTLSLPRTTTICSGHDADTEDDPSLADLPQALDLSQQPHSSGLSCLSQWKSVLSPGSAAQPSSCSISASSTGSSLQGHQERAEPRGGSLAKVSSSLEPVVPQEPSSVVGLGPQPQWSPQPVFSGGDASGLGRRRLSFQAEYWACVLPDSLPPSPDRHSPLWNPNKEYEDLLDYTYPLRPGPQLPKHLDSRVPADPVLQDSGVDLDSFSVSPASTLKSPTNVSPNCPPAEATALPFSGPREPSLKQWPSRVPQKQGGMGLASWSQLASTPRAPGSRDARWERREPALRGAKDRLTIGKHLDMGSPQLRTRDRGWPSPRPEREKRTSQSARHPTCTESRWKSEEEVESDDEYLALPARLTQVSSLVSYLGSISTLVTLPTGDIKGQSPLEVSDSDGPASLPSSSSQSQLPPGAALQGSGDPEGQNPCFLRSFVRAHDSAGEGSLGSSQALGVSSGLLKTRPSLPARLDQWPFSDPDAEGQLPRKGGEQGKESLVQCVKTFCCQLEELICWLYNVADVTDHGTAARSNLTSLKSSLQLYRQFKKDIDEHQSLTESVLQKGEILLQCLLENTPVLEDVLGRIAKQSGELESHADRLYDSILASLDMLAGCTLIPDKKPMVAMEHPCEGV